jgi:HK97 family phage major capsid protein
MSVHDLIRTLYDQRRNLIEQQRAILQEIEADLDSEGNAERQAKWEALDKEQNGKKQRIDGLIAEVEAEKDMAAQRERFEKVLANPKVQQDSEVELHKKLDTWMRAGQRGFEDVYQSPSIQVNLEQHDLTKGTATAGAELIPTGFVRTLYEHLVANAGVRQTNATVYTTTSGENLLIPKTATHGGNATIIAEGVAGAESDPTFGQVSIGSFKYFKIIDISRELLEDSAVDVVGYLGRAMGTAMGLGNGAHLVTGTGTGQPQGIANAPSGITGPVGTTLTFGLTTAGNGPADGLIDLYHNVVAGYRTRAFWIMNDLTAAVIRKMKTGSALFDYLWQPGMAAGTPDSMLGRPVVTDPTMAVPAANAVSVGFGDFSAYYAIRDVVGVRFERSDESKFATDQVSFRGILRTDGKQVVNGAAGAVKFFTHSAT